MAAHILNPVEDLMSPGEYLRGDFQPDVDFVDGRIEERNVGEFDHNQWQEALQAWFRAHHKEWHLRAFAEMRTRITATRYRVPDVAVMDMHLPVEQVLETPPVAVLEILSPEDRMTRVLDRLRDFEQLGIRNIFVIDPRTRTFARFRNGALSPCDATVPLEGSSAHMNWREIEESFY